MCKYNLEEHELGYRGMRAEWKTNWDQLQESSSFDTFSMRPLLEQMLPLLTFSVPQPRTLEYGCGTGPGACLLTARGFQVDGIDISPVAIEMAKQFAAARGLDITYTVSDMCDLRSADTLYDLIVDSFCLQCVVTNFDKANVFSAVRARLKPNSYYLTGTAIVAEVRNYGDQLFNEATGIVYTKLENNSGKFEDAVELSDGWYLPNRRHLKTAHFDRRASKSRA